MSEEYCVKEITVTTQHKEWHQGVGSSGATSGTEIIWVVKPNGDPPVWTRQEAKRITLQVRQEQLKTLVLDAKCRRADPPEEGEETVKAYEIILEKMNGG